MKKIAIIGTHGVGKTTLAYKLAAYYKSEGQNVKIINELARECPFPLNDSMDLHTTLWILHSHIAKELNAIAQKYEIIVSDRSAIDSIIYARCLLPNDLMSANFRMAQDLARNWMKSYDKIYWIRPDKNKSKISKDGVRSIDYEFQKKIDKEFEYYMDDLFFEDVQSLTTSQIFKKNIMEICFTT